LVNEADALYQDHPKSFEIKDAIDKFREEQSYDRSVSGRGDMDAARKEFEQAIRSIVGEKSVVEVKSEPKVFDLSKLSEKELVDKIVSSKDDAELNAVQKELQSRSKPDFAKEAEALGAEYQGEQKNRAGEVVFREFRITNPESPAFGANISLKEGENLAERIKAKEAQNIEAKQEVKPEAPKEPAINKNKIAQDVFVINEHLKDNRRFPGRENEIRPLH